MPSNYWLKLYHELLHDPKMAMLDSDTWRRCIEMFLFAGEHGTKQGYLPAVPHMAWILHTTEDALTADIAALEDLGILSLDDDGDAYVTQFESRQAPASAAARQKRYRERSHKEQHYGHEPRNEPVTIRNTELDTDTDTDVEAEVDPPPSNGDDPDAVTDRARLFRMVAAAAIVVNSSQAEHYALLLEDFDIGTIALAFAEAKKQGNIPRWQYLQAILRQSKARGCKPGEWTPEKQEPAGEPYARDGPLRTVRVVDSQGNITEETVG